MRIAIIGAGFSGLSAAWHLLQMTDCEVTLFDSKGIGGGASGIAAGLLHPYVGVEGKRSYLADEGMQASLELIHIAEKALGESVARRGGILRHSVGEEQHQRFLSHCEAFNDIEPHGDRCFLIRSGVTVDCPRYLEGLWQAISAKGARLICETISDLQALKSFDHVIVAAGPGIAQFPELSELRYSVLKGQVLICRAPQDLELPERSSICKGYLALSGEKGMCHLGSTYERTFSDMQADPALTKRLLFPKIAQMFPEVGQLEVVECLAALRVVSKGHYFPIAAKVFDGLWVCTAMGSRGLLYHALIGRLLVEELYFGQRSMARVDAAKVTV